jgi:hypothetical protein
LAHDQAAAANLDAGETALRDKFEGLSPADFKN